MQPSRPALLAAAREAGVPDIFVPKAIVKVAQVPILGTGKTGIRMLLLHSYPHNVVMPCLGTFGISSALKKFTHGA